MEDKLTIYRYIFAATELQPDEFHGTIHEISISQFEKDSEQNDAEIQKRIQADAYHRAICCFYETHSYLHSIRLKRKESENK